MSDEEKPLKQFIPLPAGLQNKSFDHPELIKFLTTPDLAAKGVTLITKEMKISNIKRNDLEDILDLTDLSFQMTTVGATRMADFFLIMRDAKLSATSSIDGFERREQNRTYHEELIREEKSGGLPKIFQRKKE